MTLTDVQWLRKFGLDKLPREQEAILSKKILAGDVRALDTLVRSNFWVIITLLNGVHPDHSITRAEALSAMLYRLGRAMRKFDSSRSESSTLAFMAIRHARNLERLRFRIPFGEYYLVARYQYVVEGNPDASAERLAELIRQKEPCRKTMPKTADAIRRAVFAEWFYLDATTYEQHHPLRELLSRRGWQNAAGAEARLKDVIDLHADEGWSAERIQLEWLDAAMLELDERSQMVIEGRLQGKTLVEIGEDFGVCRERIRQIEANAIDKLRKMWLREEEERV